MNDSHGNLKNTDPKDYAQQGCNTSFREGRVRDEIKEYEALKAGDIPLDPNISASVANLPKSLIRTRIAKGLTQKDLAERMGLKEQQIQRYEASGYESASLARITEIAWALERE